MKKALLSSIVFLTLAIAAPFLTSLTIKAESGPEPITLDELDEIMDGFKSNLPDSRPSWIVDCDTSPEGICIDIKNMDYPEVRPEADTTLPDYTYTGTALFNEETGKYEIDTSYERLPEKYNFTVIPIAYDPQQYPNLLIDVAAELDFLGPLRNRREDIEVSLIAFPHLDFCGSETSNKNKFACQLYASTLYEKSYRFWTDVTIYMINPKFITLKPCDCLAYVGDGKGSMYNNNLDCITHELGHVVGLQDEYQYGKSLLETLGHNPDNLNKYFNLHQEESANSNNRNCFLGHPPYRLWMGFVANWDYNTGCTLPQPFSTSKRSLMSTANPRDLSPIQIRYFNSSIYKQIGIFKQDHETPVLTLKEQSKYYWIDDGIIYFDLDDPYNTAYVEVWINGALATSEVNIREDDSFVFLDFKTPYLYPNTTVELRPFNHFGEQGTSDGFIANPAGDISVEQIAPFKISVDATDLNTPAFTGANSYWLWCDTKKSGIVEAEDRNSNTMKGKSICSYSAPGEYNITVLNTFFYDEEIPVSITFNKSGVDVKLIFKKTITVSDDGSITIK